MSETEHETEQPDEELTPFEEPAGAPDEEAAEEEEPQPEPEPEPTNEQPQDEERTKAFKAIDGSFKTYNRNVEKQLSDEITDWLYCPLCAAGAVPGFVNRHDMGRVPDEVAANVQTFLGYARETEYPDAHGIHVCPDCEGLGKVKTGSRVAEHMTVTCPTCKGYGYTPPPGAGAAAPPTNGEAPHVTADALSDLDTPERDNWGEPRVLPDGTLNDNFGKMPQFKHVHPVYGVTANLSPEELISG